MYYDMCSKDKWSYVSGSYECSKSKMKNSYSVLVIKYLKQTK
jgi:hypothetical protein